MIKHAISFGFSLFALLLIFGCAQNVARTEPYIDSFQQEPTIIKAGSEFTILYEIANPKDSPDEVYLKVSIPKESNNCIQVKDYQLRQKIIPLGEIAAKSKKAFYTTFETLNNIEGKLCGVKLELYTTATAETPIHTTDVPISIAQQTRAQ